MANPHGQGNTTALRVVQLDASELDSALVLTLRQQLVFALRHFEPGWWLSRLQPELNALLRAVIWKHSIYATSSTFGQGMLNLTYSQANSDGMPLRSKVAHGLASVLGQWVVERQAALTGFLTRHCSVPADTLQRSVRAAVAAVRLASFINILVFLQRGQHSTLLERVLGLRTYFFRSDLRRQVGFDFLNRELLWHTFGEFLLFLLPMVSVQRLKHAFKSALAYTPSALRHYVLSDAEQSSSASAGASTSRPAWAAGAAPLECAICEQLATCPYTAGCGHCFCHYCITANTQGDEFYLCPRCGGHITSSWPVAVETAPT